MQEILVKIQSEMEELRKKAHEHPQYYTGDCVNRMCAAIVARVASYTDRGDWIRQLKADETTAYARRVKECRVHL